MKICPVGGELFHADRRTDVKKFRNFAAAPKHVHWTAPKNINEDYCGVPSSEFFF